MTPDEARTSEEPDATAGAGERRDLRSVTILFLAGPVIWFSHFLAVYLPAEAACRTGGAGPRVLGLPLLSAFTAVVTAVAVVATLLLAAGAWRRWRATSTGWDAAAEGVAGGIENSPREPGLVLAGCLLGVFFALAIIAVGLPAVVLEPCLP